MKEVIVPRRILTAREQFELLAPWREAAAEGPHLQILRRAGA